MRVSSLCRHLAGRSPQDLPAAGGAKELLERRAGVLSKVKPGCRNLKCPFPLCKGKLASGWMMRRHFWDLHPLNFIFVKKEGRSLQCPCCGMQMDPQYPAHARSHLTWKG
jgi:hypothetical protein